MRTHQQLALRPGAYWWTPIVIGLCAAMPLRTSLADPTTLTISPTADNEQLELRGPDARQQIFVTARQAGERVIDVTRAVTLTAVPVGVVAIENGGLIVPLADGQAVLKAQLPDGPVGEVRVRVTGYSENRPISFVNQIVPIFTRHGCNGGGCHGKSGGQNGFRLSLLGFYPDDDYEYLVKESRGRRLFPPAPEESLLVRKATGEMPHGGGSRITRESDEYRLLLRWIAQGMPQGGPDDPAVTGISCLPAGRIMDQSAEQQITVRATYSDGTVEDVTRMTLFEPNDSELAQVSPAGLVQAANLAGEVAIMARYQGHVATFRATIPLGARVDELPPARNLIDDAVFSRLQVLGIPPSPICDDATFLRRSFLDITGTLPTEQEVREFLADTDSAKRDRLIDDLLERPAYAHHFATKWNAILRNKRRRDEDREGTYALRRWIWRSLYENKPYDQFVREIITATGDFQDHPPVVWYREVSDITQQVEDTAQLFLGVRIQCARCHHHPFERWSQDDYYGLAAFFSRIGRKSQPVGLGLSTNARDRRLFHNEGVATQSNPRSGSALRPTPLGSESLEIPADVDPRIHLADWMSDPDNRFFARSLVNRYWKHFLGRGIVEPEDDMRETNPPSNPDLLEGLSQLFVENGFDLKQLIRTICQSSTYQLSSLPLDDNLLDKQNYSRYYPKRLPAEALYDAFHQVTASQPTISELPPGTRAIQMPDPSLAPYFLTVFGQPQSDTACECERSQEANLAQSLHLLNSQDVQEKIARETGRAAGLAQDSARPTDEKVRELYRWVYARDPDEEELNVARNHIEKHAEQPQLAYEDLVWALINTKEFLFIH